MSMLVPLASGSTGNCTLLELGQHRILIDLGISCRRITAGLRSLGLSLRDLDAVVITHAHTDHTNGLETFLRYCDAPVYMTQATADRVGLEGVHVFRRGDGVAACPAVDIRSFPTPHDCPGSVGYVFSSGGLRVGYATDLGTVSDATLQALEGCAFQVLEFNHDVQMLINGPYPRFLQARILSDQGHLNNEAAGEAAAWLAQRGTKQFLLAHLSQQNNTPEAALAAAAAALAGTDVRFSAAPVGMGEVFSLDALL